MASEAQLWMVLVSLVLVLLPCLSVAAKQTYIVQMKHHSMPSSFATHSDWYSAHLQSLSDDSDSLLYTYNTAYHGFAASLDPDQAETLRQSDSVVGVYEDTIYDLHTTRTPEFLGLETANGLWAGYSTQDLNQASNDVIVGVLDTGVWPESKSFDDAGMPDIPSRWQGQCESGADFTPSLCCNKKLIGARSFSKGYHMASGGSYMRNPQGGRVTARPRRAWDPHFQYRCWVPRGKRQPARLRQRNGSWDGASRAGRHLQGLLDHGLFRVRHSRGFGSGNLGRSRCAVALSRRRLCTVLPRHHRYRSFHCHGEGHIRVLLGRKWWAQ
ncbi:hypothetical protein M0R45_003697 [Rubus argutus]|uniref:Inhibitor I9 domain-containing protein n=1 Tax=Rubus argutus TaxID=59490 RepID=A0AAW1YG34_RUBAR